MFTVLQITTVFLVAIAMALAVAHALELPGKLRLDKKAYYAVQSIYYPGFTIGGIGEAAGTIAAIILLFLTPRASVDFWLTAVAVIGLIGMQGVYWIVTHPDQSVLGRGREVEPSQRRLLRVGYRSHPARQKPAARLDEVTQPLGILPRRARGVCAGELRCADHCNFANRLAEIGWRLARLRFAQVQIAGN
jgi:hypothetical protein